MGKVDVLFFTNAGEVELGGIVEAGEGVAFASAIGVEGSHRLGRELVVLNEATYAEGWVRSLGVGAWDEEGLEAVGEIEPLAVVFNVFEATTELAEVGEGVLANVMHQFPEEVAGMEKLFAGKGAQDGAIDGRVEFGERFAGNAEPFGGFDGAASVKVFGGLKPVAELARLVVKVEILQHEGEGAYRWVVRGELMVVEVEKGWVVGAAYVDDDGIGFGEVGLGGFAAGDGDSILGNEKSAGEKLVFVGGAGMSNDETGSRHVRGVQEKFMNGMSLRSCERRQHRKDGGGAPESKVPHFED